MYVIGFFGLLMMTLSLIMIINPEHWANSIVKFSKKPYFHPFEIVSRFGFGLFFVIFANQTVYPKIISAIGYLLIAVGAGLLLTPPSKHRQFALWSSRKFKDKFRPMGFVSLLFGAFLIYGALGA